MDSRRNSQTHDGDAATRWESSHDYPSHSSGRRLIFPRDIEPLQVEDCIRRKEAFSHAVTRARWRCVRDGHKTNKDAPSLLYNRLSLDPVHSNHKLRPFSTKNQSRGDPTKKKNLKSALTSCAPLLQTPQSVHKNSAPPTNFNSKLGGVMQQASRTWYPTSGASPDQYSSVPKPLLPLQLPECSQTILLLQAAFKMHSCILFLLLLLLLAIRPCVYSPRGRCSGASSSSSSPSLRLRNDRTPGLQNFQVPKYPGLQNSGPGALPPSKTRYLPSTYYSSLPFFLLTKSR